MSVNIGIFFSLSFDFNLKLADVCICKVADNNMERVLSLALMRILFLLLPFFGGLVVMAPLLLKPARW